MKLRIDEGMRVQVIIVYPDISWMHVHENYLKPRKVGAIGKVEGQVPEHSGSLWWVKHEDGSMAAYHKNELQEIN